MKSNILQILKRYWRFFVLIAVPLILLPLIFIDGSNDNCADTDLECLAKDTKFKCAYVILIMAIYWVCEAMPLAITSLLPVLFLPLLGVQNTDEVTPNYMKETNMMFIAGLLIALGVEYCNLHRRIALRVMTIIGSSPVRLMLGVMMTTMFLSMWISNTATTAMMLPIVVAVLEELHEKVPPAKDLLQLTENQIDPRGIANTAYLDDDESNIGHSTKDKEHPELNIKNHIQTEANKVIIPKSSEVDESYINMRKMFLFATCYSSNLGGTGTIIGSGTNLILQEHMKKVDISQGGKYTNLTFATWMAYNIPGMLLNGIVALAYLTLVFQIIPNLRRKKNQNVPIGIGSSENVARMLRRKYNDLGYMTFHEIAVSVLFFCIVMLWFFRDPKFISGWGEQIKGAEVGDSTAGMIIIFFLFVIPKNLDHTMGISGTLLDWKYAQAKIPWGLILLMGGGFAISDASDISGLSEWIGSKFDGLDVLPNAAILIIIMVLTAGVTEVASNAAVANVILPILLSLSERMNLHPLYLTLPAAVSCSFAFMLPVATPPNAIVFATGDLKILDMVKTGLFLNVSCILVVFCLHITYAPLIFDFNNYIYANKTVTV